MKQFPRSRVKRAADKVRRNQKVTTFEESITAAKVLARVILAGRLDEAGSVAAIEIEDLVYTAGQANGVNIKVTPLSDDAEVTFGREHKEGWDIERVRAGSNVRYLPSGDEGEQDDQPSDAEKPASVRLSITA